MSRVSGLEKALAELRGRGSIIDAAERISNFGTYLHDPVAEEAFWSPQLKRIYGMPEDEGSVRLSDVFARIHPDDLASVQESLRLFQAPGDRVERSYRIVLPDGRVRHLRAWGELVMVEDYERPIAVGTVQDVTAEWQAQQTIRDQAALLADIKAEDLYETGRSAMGTMAATLAHELNQPLTAAAFFARAAAKASSKDRRDLLANHLASVEENVLRAGEIIRRLRDSVHSGHSRSDHFICKELIDEALRFSSIGCEGVTFELALQGVEIHQADRVQIQQVLVNLIRNACQAVSDQAEPIVTITTCRVDGRDSLFRAVVEDNGPGIDPALLPGIFDGGVSTKEGGMGLGLSICRTIIEAHGGTIWAENTAKGARFTFDIPRNGAANGKLDQRPGIP